MVGNFLNTALARLLRFPWWGLGRTGRMLSEATMKRLKTLIICLTLSVGTLWGWDSSILRKGSNGRLVYYSDEAGNRLADFSHAGYRSGEVPLPNRPVVHTISPLAGDNTAHIQAAIDLVAALPLEDRGDILLTRGRYEVGGIVTIHSDGIILRGEGNGASADNTIIVGTGTNQRKEQGIILIKPKSLGNEIEPGTLQKVVSEFLPIGSRTIEVENASKYSVGDYLIIRHEPTEAWLEAINYGNVNGDEAVWVAGQNDLKLFFHGTVTAIVGNKVKLDTPLYHPLDRSLSEAVIYRHSGQGLVQESGVENLRVVSENSGGTDEAHAWDCVHFINARNCWAKNVVSEGFAESGFRFTKSTRSTVQNCQAVNPVSQITGGRRYNFYVGGNCHDILFKNCLATRGRHCFVGNGAAGVNGIVFTQSESRFAYSTSENHRRWGSGFLWDDIEWNSASTNTVLALYNRGDAGTSHGWTGTGLVAWNIRAPGNTIVCSEPPIGQNYAIGCDATITGGNYPRGFVEGTGQSPSIPSLYEAQLAERLTHGVGPDAPARLKVSHYANTGSRFVVLEWTDIALDETAYVLERSTNGGSSYSVITTLSANTEHFSDTSLTSSNNYTYRLKATNSIGESAYGNPVTVDLTVDELPEAVTVQAEEFTAQSGATVRWDRHGFTGFGYVDINGPNTWFELRIDGGVGGLTPMVFRYGGGETFERPCTIYVNGDNVATGSFATPGSWNAWTSETVMVDLDPGLNTVRIQPAGSTNAPNFDKVDVYATPPIYAAGETSDGKAVNAFDGNPQTFWKHHSPYGSWIQTTDSGNRQVQQYLVTSGTGPQATDPKTWNLLGSNDGGANWTTLDTRSNIVFTTRKQTKTFTVANPGTYSLYRMEVTEVGNSNTADSIQIAELSMLYEIAEPLTPNPASFAEPPYPISESAISMKATVGSSSVGSVEYYFEEVSGNPGGTASGWISSPEYTDSGLTSGYAYRYTVTLRDLPGNETAPSSALGASPYQLTTKTWNAAASGDGRWTTRTNWTGTGPAPSSVDQFIKVLFSARSTQDCFLDSAATVAQLIMGEDGDNTGNVLRLTAGADLTCGLTPFDTTNWTAVGYNRDATLSVESNARLETVSHLWIGYTSPAIGRLVVDGGTVEVKGLLGLGRSTGTGFVEIKNGGTLICDSLSFRSNSTLNLDEGALILNGNMVASVSSNYATGRITAYHGTSEIEVNYDAGSNQTTVTAKAAGYEAWATSQGTPIGNRLDDFDDDNRNNFYEYALNGNPLDPSATGVDPVLKAQNGDIYLVYLQRNNDPTLLYRIETKSESASQQWIEAEFTDVHTTPVDNLPEFNEVWTRIPPNTSALIRLTISNR